MKCWAGLSTNWNQDTHVHAHTHICCAMLSHFSCVWLFETPVESSLPGSSGLWDSLGKNTELGCHVLLEGIFPTQGSNPHFLSPALATGCSYHLCHPGSHIDMYVHIHIHIYLSFHVILNISILVFKVIKKFHYLKKSNSEAVRTLLQRTLT